MSVQNLLRNLVTEAQLNQQQSLRSQKMKELAAAAPRGQAARLSAPSPIVRPADNSMAQGMSSLGKALGDIGDMRKESAAKNAISALYAPPPMSEADLMEGVEPSAPQVNSTMLQRVLMQHQGTNAAKQGMNMVNILARQEQQGIANQYNQDQLSQRLELKEMDLDQRRELKGLEIESKKLNRLGTTFRPMTPKEKEARGISNDVFSEISLDGVSERRKTLNTLDTKLQLAKAGSNRGQNEFDKGLDKFGLDYIKKTTEGGDAARKTLGNNRRITSLLDKGFTPGMLTQTKMTIGKFANLIGAPKALLDKLGIMDMNQIAKGETFANIAAGFVFDALQAFTGAISEGERAYVESVVPTLSMTPGGIRSIVKIKDALARRAMLKEKMLADWRQKRVQEGQRGSPESRDSENRTFDMFYKEEIDRQGNIIGDDLRREIEAAQSASPSSNMQFEQVTIGKGKNEKTYQIVGGKYFEMGED